MERYAICTLNKLIFISEGKGIPVTVRFYSGGTSRHFHFDRIFRYPGKPDYHFRSRMIPVGGNEVIEVMRFGMGWRCAYDWTGEKITLSHRGYIWHAFGMTIPLPIGWLIGVGYAEEKPVSDSCFSMWTHTNHSLFGEMFRYEGEFKITEVASQTKEAWWH